MEFTRYNGQHYRGWIRTDFDPPSQVLEGPSGIQSLPDAQMLINSAGRQIYRVPLVVGGASEPCFTYYFKNASLGRSLRSTTAFRAFSLSRKLSRYGFGTFEILLAAKRRGDWLNWHSFVIARAIKEVYEVASGGNHRFPIHPIAEFSPKLAAALGEELAGLHQQGFFHGDLKSRHVLVGASSNPHFKFFFVDLEKSCHVPRLPPLLCDLLICRDFVQLFASLPDNAGTMTEKASKDFFEAYFDSSKLSDKRRSRIRRYFQLYQDGGPLRQGETLLGGIWRSLFRKDS